MSALSLSGPQDAFLAPVQPGGPLDIMRTVIVLKAVCIFGAGIWIYIHKDMYECSESSSSDRCIQRNRSV